MKRLTTAAISTATYLTFLTALPVAGEAQISATQPQQAVLVTGASTGIGRKITERLAADGYFVYAGARKEDDLKALDRIKNVQAVRLDVTQTADITAAVETITRGGRGLYGLVNNAGVASRGSFIAMRQDEFELIMGVNEEGPFRITKAFAPLIIAQKGRITTMGSISGIVAGQDTGAYAMSKHALEAFTDSLALQMNRFGVQVSIIEPGDYDSRLGANAAKRVGASSYGSVSGPSPVDRSNFKEPDEVADAVEKALFEPNPKRRYMVTPNQAEAESTIRKQIEQLVQLNEGQTYTYDRSALHKMLDEALTGSRPKTDENNTEGH